jgi:4-amino-4-deoxy-L-arabinose transferase-like glycosyltransferase
MLDRDPATRLDEAPGTAHYGHSQGILTTKTGYGYTPTQASAADAGELVAWGAGWRSLFEAIRQRITDDAALLFAINVFITHRLLLSALGAVLAPVAPMQPLLGSSLLRGVDPRHWGPNFFFLGPWQRWDTNWYLDIARQGYAVGNGTTNFPPLYPMLVGLLGRVLFEQYMLAALLISSLAYIGTLYYLYILAQRFFNEERARYAVLFMATFPSAFFLLSGYTESLYLALALAAFYYGEQKRWLLAAGLAALASITRLQGVILVIPLFFLYIQQQDFKWRKIGREGWLLLISPAPLVAYMLYVYLIVGDHNFSNHLPVVWHIRTVTPWESFFGGIIGMFDREHLENLLYNVLDLMLLTIFICLLIVWAQKKLPPAYLLYGVLSLAVLMTRQGTDGLLWMSMNRYLLSIFPAFILLGAFAPRYLLKVGAVFQFVWALLFICWMWAG